MSTMLHKIVKQKEQELSQLEANMKSLVESQLYQLPLCRSFYDSLNESKRPVSVIAEIKKASPSKGIIRPDFTPLTIAEEYNQAGTDAMSVLTDKTFFMGDIEYLKEVKKISNAPLLRKDFIIDELQIYESRYYGADCILLIAAILNPEQISRFYEIATKLGMDVLVEVHDEQELDKVLSVITPKLLGINNRDLKTFHTSLKNTEKIINTIPTYFFKQSIVISESGISVAKDIDYLRQLGVRSVLVGEHFMRQINIKDAVIDLVG